jgi:hypothetical protein
MGLALNSWNKSNLKGGYKLKHTKLLVTYDCIVNSIREINNNSFNGKRIEKNPKTVDISRFWGLYHIYNNLAHDDHMASQEGFEPPTDALEGRCSIQLSY